MEKKLTPEMETKLNEYLNKSIANGWVLVNQNNDGFVLESKSFSIFVYIITTLGGTLFFSLIIGFPIVWLIFFMIVCFFFSNSKIVLYGSIDYKNNEVVINKNDKLYKKINIK